MVSVFALTLIFADGYLGGSSHAQDFKTAAMCREQGSRMAAKFVSLGHPTSFICNKAQAQRHTVKPETIVIHHTMPMLVDPSVKSTAP